MMNLYEKLPPRDQMEKEALSSGLQPKKVNGHFHTPYSFSAFSDLEQVLKMARDEAVDVLGINDFYTMAGYGEFAELCRKYNKFPLFNIEFMGLLKREQEQGIKVNDPTNPGRTYFSGKGLDFPVTLAGPAMQQLISVRGESDKQTREMVGKASAHLKSVTGTLTLDYDDILKRYTKGMVRERHIARAIRISIFERYPSDQERKEMIRNLYGGVESKADFNDPASLEGEIRGQLLKSGGVAFVKEDPRAFLEISEVIGIILQAGGIPCYPVLLDDTKGNYTEYESDMEKLYNNLVSMNVFSLELIPGRNNFHRLREFVEYFDKRGFIITFGTEHNTPSLDPLTVSAGELVPLDDFLLGVSYKGACVVAAHQYLRAAGEQGFVDPQGRPAANPDYYVSLGNTIIQHFTAR